jgi:hypothetical protein
MQDPKKDPDPKKSVKSDLEKSFRIHNTDCQDLFIRKKVRNGTR